MTYDPYKHHRRSMRLAGYDYASPGGYFVTICSQGKRCVFGRIIQDEMKLNRYGRIAREKWLELAKKPQVELDEFVIMPNHFHGILIITGTDELAADVSRPRKFGDAVPGSLSTFVGQFKADVTKSIRAQRAELYPQAPPVHVWQENFYDHIIRDEKELNSFRCYIIENPQRWATDQDFVTYGHANGVSNPLK